MSMSRSLKGPNRRFSWRRRGSFFKPFLEVLEDRRLLNGSGFLQGTVLDNTDPSNPTPIQGATVRLEHTDGSSIPGFNPVTTGSDGRYSFTGLDAGTYLL